MVINGPNAHFLFPLKTLWDKIVDFFLFHLCHNHLLVYIMFDLNHCEFRVETSSFLWVPLPSEAHLSRFNVQIMFSLSSYWFITIITYFASTFVSRHVQICLVMVDMYKGVYPQVRMDICASCLLILQILWARFFISVDLYCLCSQFSWHHSNYAQSEIRINWIFDHLGWC